MREGQLNKANKSKVVWTSVRTSRMPNFFKAVEYEAN